MSEVADKPAEAEQLRHIERKIDRLELRVERAIELLNELLAELDQLERAL